MADPFVAEIRVVGFNFAPTGWALCNGHFLPLSQNTALFSLLGTTYGGDGKSTFALRTSRARSSPSGAGAGPEPVRPRASRAGHRAITLLQSEMPLHNHSGRASIDDATFQSPAPDRAPATSNPGFAYQSNPARTSST